MTVAVDRQSGLTTISWGDGSRGNPVDRSTAQEIAQAVESSQSDGSRALVLAPRGDAVCSGWHLSEIREAVDDPEFMASVQQSGRHLLDAMVASTIPVALAATGPALGFGLALVARSHLVVASRQSHYGLPEISIGIVPTGVVDDVAAAVGPRRARAWARTGRVIESVEAHSAGLVDEVVEPELVHEQLTSRLRSVTALDEQQLGPLAQVCRLGHGDLLPGSADRGRTP